MFLMHCSVVAVVSASVFAAPPVFDTPIRSYSVGAEVLENPSTPTGHAMGDIDGDGDLDIVVSMTRPEFTSVSPIFAVLRNAGDGTYGAPEFTTAAADTSSVVLVDIDGDGDLDAAMTRLAFLSEGRVLVYRNNGSGSFSLAMSVAAPYWAKDIAAADVDADGDMDLMTANWNSESVSVFYNEGTGLARVDLATPEEAHHVGAADLDGDGLPEILCGQNWGPMSLMVFMNDGSRQFAAPVGYPAAGSPQAARRDFATGDVDGDGDIDVVVGGGQVIGVESPVTLLRNDGTGVLSGEATPTVQLFDDRGRLSLEDVTGDGLLDLLITGSLNGQDGWVLLPADGDGSFGAGSAFAVGEEATTITAGDTNGDGWKEVLVTCLYSKAVTVHASREGAFDTPPRVEVGQFSRYYDLADIDLDGDVDAVSAYSAHIYSLYNDGAGGFTAVARSAPLGCMDDVVLEDINGDGFPDLLMVKNPNCSPYNFYTALNNGDGSFGPISTWFLNSAGGNHIATMDWDADGDLDVLVTETLGCPGCPHRNYLLDNNGDGTFAPFRVLPAGERNGPRRAFGADVNGDGHVDIVGGVSLGVQVWPGNGDGTFGATIVSDASWSPWWAVPTDLNGDGVIDIAYASSGESHIGLGGTTGAMLGNGDGTFTETDYEWGPFSLQLTPDFGVAAMDADHDGHMDIVTAGVQGAALLLYRGNGDGTIEPQQRFGMDGQVHQPRVADLDGDGVEDVAAMLQTSIPVGQASFSFVPGVAGGCAADLTGDGVLDFFDVQEFLGLFAGGDAAADLTGDGVLNFFDVQDYLALFAAGCP